jgi:HEAT repeat protein
MLDQAFEALQTYDWGVDPAVLQPIDAEIVASRCDALARKNLEDRLIAVLGQCVSRDAKDTVCRYLKVVGTAAAVPALGAMLPYAEHSHMARYALESIPGPQADEALREALPVLRGELLAGVLGSLGFRGDAASVPAVAPYLHDADPQVAKAAALALGTIGSAYAAAALASASPTAPVVVQAVTDAQLTCAEKLVQAGDKSTAQGIYARLAKDGQPKHVRLAATRGMLSSRG